MTVNRQYARLAHRETILQEQKAFIWNAQVSKMGSEETETASLNHEFKYENLRIVIFLLSFDAEGNSSSCFAIAKLQFKKPNDTGSCREILS